MTRREQAENLRNLLHIVDRMRDLIPPDRLADIDWEATGSIPGLRFVLQGVEGMIYELEQVR